MIAVLRRRRPALFVAGLALSASTAAAQNAADVPAVRQRRLAFGVEFAGTIAPRDPGSFFNYTGYEQDGLRLARLRLLAEWRLRSNVSLLAEARAENHSGIEAAAWYLRWRPFQDRDLDIQVGRIPPVIAAFARRAYGRDNLVIGTPLAYSYLTSLRSDALPATTDDLLRMRGRGWQPSFPIGLQTTAPGLPLIAVFRWDLGAEARWRHRAFELAGAVTEDAPAATSMPDTRHSPAISARAAVSSSTGWTIGVSAASGLWIRPDIAHLVRPDASGRESIVAADAEFGRFRWLVRGELIRASFSLPLVSSSSIASLTAWSGFLQGRYRFTPRWSVAGHVDRLMFGDPPQGASTPRSWDARVTRVEGIVGIRMLRSMDVRVGWQQNWRDGGRVHDHGFPTAQVIYWF